MLLRSLLQQLKNRPATRNPPVIAALAIQNLPPATQIEVLNWLEDIVENLRAGRRDILVFQIGSVHSELCTPEQAGLPETIFLELLPPQFTYDETDSPSQQN